MKVDIEKLFLDSLINNLPDYIYFKDTDSRFLMINRALSAAFGLQEPSEALGNTDHKFYDEASADQARKDELKVMRSGKPLIGKEEYRPNDDGEPHWVLTTKLPLHDTDGQMIGTFGVSRDITEAKLAQQRLVESESALRHHQDTLEETVQQRTEELSTAKDRMAQEIQERKLIEQSLRVEEERYRRLLGVNATYIYTVTIEKRKAVTTEHGSGCINVTGYSPADFQDDPNLWIIMVHPEDRDFVKSFIIEDLTQRNNQNQIEHRIVHKDGRVRWVRNTVVHHYNDTGELIRYDGLVEDITARRFADERQRENERLRAVVNLAGGVAKSYSSAMSQIDKHAAAISKRVKKDDSLQEHAESISTAVASASTLNSRLQFAAKAYDHDPQAKDFLKALDLGKAVSKAVKSARKAFLPQNIEVETVLPTDLPRVSANLNQLLGTIISMLTNASEAMPDGGTITISASSKNILRSSHRWNQIARGGQFVILRIIDTGVGMDRELQKSVFNTFFTTRTDGSFGLGLAIAQASAKSWGGWIQLRSTPTKGSVFRVFIPTVKQTDALVEPKRPAITIKGRTALVVDDNEQCRNVVVKALTDQGMTVLTASNDIEAIDIFANNMDRISLCVIDLVLGTTNLERTITQIYDLKPEAQVIVTSGFSRDFARSNLPVGAWSFLQKPFEPSGLSRLATEIVARDLS